MQEADGEKRREGTAIRGVGAARAPAIRRRGAPSAPRRATPPSRAHGSARLVRTKRMPSRRACATTHAKTPGSRCRCWCPSRCDGDQAGRREAVELRRRARRAPRTDASDPGASAGRPRRATARSARRGPGSGSARAAGPAAPRPGSGARRRRGRAWPPRRSTASSPGRRRHHERGAAQHAALVGLDDAGVHAPASGRSRRRGRPPSRASRHFRTSASRSARVLRPGAVGIALLHRLPGLDRPAACRPAAGG